MTVPQGSERDESTAEQRATSPRRGPEDEASRPTGGRLPDWRHLLILVVAAGLMVVGLLVVGDHHGLIDGPRAADLPLAPGLFVDQAGPSCGSGGCAAGVTLVRLGGAGAEREIGAAEINALRDAGWVEIESMTYRSGGLQARVSGSLVDLSWPDREGWSPSNDGELPG